MRVTAQGLTLAFIHVDVKVKMSGRCAVYTLYKEVLGDRLILKLYAGNNVPFALILLY